MSAPGPVADWREPDLRFVAHKAGNKEEEDSNDDITEMEPPPAHELEDVCKPLR